MNTIHTKWYLLAVALCVFLAVSSMVMAQEKPVLRTIVFQGWARTPSLQKQVAEYEKLTGVKVEIEEVPFAQLHEKMILDFASQGGSYDFVAPLTDWFTELVRGKYIAPIDDFIKKDPPEEWPNAFPPALLKLQSKDGKLYGLPTHDGPIMLYYRKDLFDDSKEKEAFKKQYGYELVPPATWSQFLDMAKFFNRPDMNLNGTVTAAKQGGQQLAYDFFLMLWSYGGNIFDEKWHPIFNSQAGIDGLQFYVDLRNKWGVTPKASTTYDETENGPIYLDSRVALMWHWSHIAAWSEMEDRSKIIGKNGYTVFPVSDLKISHTTLDIYWFWAISSASKNQEEAYKLVKWLCNKKNDKEAAQMGTIACRLSTFKDPEILKQFPFYESIEKALAAETKTTPQIPEYAQVDDLIGIACSKVIAGEKTAKEALDEAAQQVEEIMKKAGYYKE
ncbi:MAG: extracellular solute-binding protein [Candidatus Atribacteria bacterium]|nr:extracellular solute-binding protein [Candidatus Atribacteria bacterium]